MIDLKDAQEQMSRMIGLNFGPRAAQQRQEVLKIMCQARTVLILHGAVTSWLESSPNFPKPAEIAPIITSLNVAHDQAIESEARRREWKELARYASSEQGEADAKDEMAQIRALFLQRLATVNQRHAGSSEKERERIKGEILKMLAHIDRGADFKGLIGIRASSNPISDGDAYHGEF